MEERGKWPWVGSSIEPRPTISSKSEPRSEVTAVEGSAGDFTLTVGGPERRIRDQLRLGDHRRGVPTLRSGVARHRNTATYEYPDVIALQDLEAMLKDHNVVRPSNGEGTPNACASCSVWAARDRQIGNEYCSKVCCGVASKEAIEVRELLPDCQVYIFYIDMRMYGYW